MELKARIGIKINSEEGDGHQDGEQCKIIGILSDKLYACLYEKFPIPVFTLYSKVALTGEIVNYKAKEELNNYLVSLKNMGAPLKLYEA